MEARNLASCDSIGRDDIIEAVRERHRGDGGQRKGAGGGAHRKVGGRENGRGGRRGRQGRGGKGTNKDGGGPAAAACGDGSSAKAADGGTSEVRGHKCGKKGHWRIDCALEICSRCHGRGRAADVCLTSKEEAVLATSDDDDVSDTAEASAFKARETGKCSNVSGKKGEGESAWQVGDEAWLCESGASTHMTPSADGMINYIECNWKLRIADGSTRTIEGYGDINFAFRSGNGLVRITLTNVAHVPDLRYDLLSLPTLVKHDHTFEGRPAGIVVKLKSERSIVFPLTGNLYSLYGYRVDCSTTGDSCAVLAPGKLPNKPVVNINDYHCAAGHPHETLLRKTAEQQGVVLEGKLLECKGCSMAKGLRRGIKQSTHARADKKLGRVFVDLSAPKVVESDGGKRCTLIVRDDFSRYTWVYFMRHKSDAAETFK